MYLFYADGNPMTIRKARALPVTIVVQECSSSFYSENVVATLSPYTTPFYLTTAPISSHFVPLMFVRAYPPPPGISDGCSTSWSNWCLYYVNYPLPLDGEASVNNPWSTKLGAPLITGTGGVVSPTVGLLASGQTLIAGSPALSILYPEPGLFYRSGTTDQPWSAPAGYPVFAS